VSPGAAKGSQLHVREGLLEEGSGWGRRAKQFGIGSQAFSCARECLHSIVGATLTYRVARGTSTMATFTRITEEETPSIVVHAEHKVATINDNIYGGFTEWVRGCAIGSSKAYRKPGTWAAASTVASTILATHCPMTTASGRMSSRP